MIIRKMIIKTGLFLIICSLASAGLAAAHANPAASSTPTPTIAPSPVPADQYVRDMIEFQKDENKKTIDSVRTENDRLYQHINTLGMIIGLFAAIFGVFISKWIGRSLNEIKNIKDEAKVILKNMVQEAEKTKKEIETSCTELTNNIKDKSEEADKHLDKIRERRELAEAITGKDSKELSEPLREKLSNTAKEIEKTPVEKRTALDYSLMAINSPDPDQQISLYTEAIRLKPDYALAYNNRGIVWSNKGDYDKAIEDYNEAIRLKPDYELAYNNRGYVWRKKEDYDKAIANCNEAIRLKPDFALAYYNMACAYSMKRELAEAIRWLETAAEKGYGYLIYTESDSELENLRNDPACKEKFEEIMKRIEENERNGEK